MSILQSAVDRLFTEKNRVIYDPAGARAVFEVTALALFTFDEELVQLVFCKNFEYPLEISDETMYDPESREQVLLRMVKESDIARNYLRMATAREWGSLTDHTYGNDDPATLFSYLIGAVCGGNTRMLEFLPTRPIYPVYYGHDKLQEAFDGVTSFIDVNFAVHRPRMLLGLNWRSPEQRNRGRDTPNPLEFGNALIWSGSDNCVHWVTRKNGLAISLGTVGKVEDYSDLLRFTRQFCPQGWDVRTVLPMPYHLPKMAPKEDTPEPDNSVFYLNVMQHLANAAPGQIEPAIQALLKAAATTHLSKPQHDHASDEIHAQVEALNSIFATKQGELDYEVLTTLGACERKHCPATNPGIRDQYVRALDEAMNEAFVLIDGVGVKKRDEIKRQLMAQFLKRFQDPSKLS